MKGIRVLLLLICLFSVSASMEIKPTEAQEKIQPGIILESTYPLRTPHLSIGPNWTYPYAQMPVLRQNQSINGSIVSDASGSAFMICIKRFSVSELLNSSLIKKSHGNCLSPSVVLNQTESANFTLPGIIGGLYTLSASDINSTEEVAALQLLVTKENLSLQLPDSIQAGEPLKVKANISGLDQNKIFAAIMISTEDYDNMSLSFSSNETGSGYTSTLKLVDKVQLLPTLTDFSSELAMNLMYLLPANSAVGMQESSEPDAELFLLTSPDWPKGDYILSCGVYSKTKGLLDLKQEKIMVM